MGRPLRLATGALAGALLALLVIAALLLAGPAFGTVAAEELGMNQSVPHAPPDFGSTERLILPDDDQRTAEATLSVDPGLTTSNEFQHLAYAWQSERFQSELAAEGTSEGKVAILEETVDDLQQKIIAMNEAEKAAYRSFARGDISAAELLARLAMIEQQGALLDERLQGVRAASRGITSPVVADNVTSLQANVGWLQLEAETFSGPIRNDAWAVVTGNERDPAPVSVTASPNGYILATTDGVMYTREIYHAGNHDRAGGGFLSTEAGGERVVELYPWTAEEAFEQDPRVRGDIFREVLTHPHGTTTTIFSGATELPYREIHEIDLAAVPTVTAVTEEGDGIVVTLERTYAGGPAQVLVTTADGDPIPEATVVVDGQRERVTDGDGSVWFTTSGTELSVVVTTDNGEVTVDASLPVGDPPRG